MNTSAPIPSEWQPAAADFMATVAHELRQPLSNIESIAYHLSLVLPKGDEAVQRSLTRIRQLVEQSNGIIADGLRQAATALVAQEPPKA